MIMASNETAALVVALSAQVSKFQKDIDQAVAIAAKGTKQIVDRFEAAGGVITNKLGGVAQGAAAQLGTIGLAMSALGPIGLTVAAGIGTLALAFNFVSEKTEIFAEKAKRLKEVSEQVGVTATQLRILFEAGKQVGVESEQTEKFLQRFALALETLKTSGGGPLFDALVRIDAGLVRQISSAKNLAAAIEILQKAYNGLSDEGKKLDLIKDISGQRNLSFGRVLGSIGEQGGFPKMEEQAEALGKAIDTLVNDKIVKLKREIEELKRSTDNVYGRMFAVETLEAQKRSAEFWLQLAQNAERFTKASRESVDAVDAGQRQGTQFGRRFRGQDRPFVAGEQSSTEEGLAERLLKLGQDRLTVIQATDKIEGKSVPLPTERPASAGAGKVPAAVQLELMKKWTSLLGEAITPTEALQQKFLELQVALEKGGVKQEHYNRALEAFKNAQSAAALSAREGLGIASEEEIVAQKRIDLNDKLAKGYVKTAEEKATAERIIARESRAAAEALQVRASATPELTRALIDAANATKQFDQIATSSFNNAADAFADVVTGTKTLKAAVTDMVNSLIRDLSRAAFKNLIGSLIPGGFGGVGGGGSGPTVDGGGSGGGVPGFASGTDFAPGGMAVVGERGRELVNLPRGSQVIPNNVARGMTGGVKVNVNVTNNVSGAEPRVMGARDDGAGNINMDLLIQQKVIETISNGRADGAMGGRFGARPPAFRR